MITNKTGEVSFRVYRTAYFAGFLNFADTFFVHGFLRGNFIILLGLNIFFKGLNWFYYTLSKASDLRCQQVIFSKSQVKSQVMDSKSKSSPKSSQCRKLQVKSQATKTATRVRLESKSPDSSLHL